MIKFIKEIFSAENFKRAMLYSSLTNPNLSVSEFIHVSNVLKDMDEKNINKDTTKEANIKKVA